MFPFVTTSVIPAACTLVSAGPYLASASCAFPISPFSHNILYITAPGAVPCRSASLPHPMTCLISLWTSSSVPGYCPPFVSSLTLLMISTPSLSHCICSSYSLSLGLRSRAFPLQLLCFAHETRQCRIGSAHPRGLGRLHSVALQHDVVLCDQPTLFHSCR